MCAVQKCKNTSEYPTHPLIGACRLSGTTSPAEPLQRPRMTGSHHRDDFLKANGARGVRVAQEKGIAVSCTVHAFHADWPFPSFRHTLIFTSYNPSPFHPYLLSLTHYLPVSFHNSSPRVQLSAAKLKVSSFAACITECIRTCHKHHRRYFHHAESV